MDIICGKCGKHLVDIEAARQHKHPIDLAFTPLSIGEKSVPKLIPIEEFGKNAKAMEDENKRFAIWKRGQRRKKWMQWAIWGIIVGVGLILWMLIYKGYVK